MAKSAHNKSKQTARAQRRARFDPHPSLVAFVKALAQDCAEQNRTDCDWAAESADDMIMDSASPDRKSRP